MLDWPVKLRRSSGEEVLRGRRGVLSVSQPLSCCERLRSCSGRLVVPSVPAPGWYNCLLGLQAPTSVLVGDEAESRRAAKRVRSASRMAEKVLMSFMLSSMLRVISVSSPMSNPPDSGLSCTIVLIPSSARCTVLSSSSASTVTAGSIVRVKPSLNRSVVSEGESADLLLSTTDCVLSGE